MDVKTMRAVHELTPPTSDELSIGVENDHRVVALAVLVHRVVNIDAPLRVFADTVGVAIFDPRRQFTPVVDHFVNVFAAPHYGMKAAGFVGSSNIHFRYL
jgi:hypothetical protein